MNFDLESWVSANRSRVGITIWKPEIGNVSFIKTGWGWRFSIVCLRVIMEATGTSWREERSSEDLALQVSPFAETRLASHLLSRLTSIYILMCYVSQS